ncbi:DNA helicase-2/ATP-dependent DNA helicase PcrA [Curtobacterium sp. PhB142]|uniref:ATP-dependent helicase n=1 Tax=unclassified Curtobacterium TaxID=257496 RepID=UPI00104ABC47|nr:MULTISPECIES: UvrD-helicase domain-containing protein [unclassified Curtobacterium]TCL86320.1 DNA helicase-2/ATP-dependent DNA helicase PcrA [Curtobacterium sp. PhB142]TCM02510.1 DNA helicase-2/ATP-dependent DNA helicase PcrA [Curtobacterium sp. PhB134]
MTIVLDPFESTPEPGAGARAYEDPFTAGLNPQQKEAVEYRGESLLIVAGAGSGKTSVLTRRIALLLANREAWPSQILAITFTNKAAAEMRERVRALVGGESDGMWISTFHSACVRILRREAERFGFAQSFTIYDSADSKALLKRIIKDLEADTLGLTVGAAASKISKLKNELQDIDSYARNINVNDPQEVMFTEVFRRYTNDLRRANAFDFDDLIGQTVFLFRAFPEVAALYQRRFRFILVDEYQDTNHAQYSLIRELTRPVPVEQVDKLEDSGQHVARMRERDGSIAGASLTVVGDSDQSIYAFRGADIRNIVEFERDFPNSKVILLEQNYRSTQTILDAANAVIANNFDRQAKNLFTDVGAGEKIVGFTGYTGHDEAQFVADEIQRLREDGMDYRDMAVFYRTNSQTRALEEILIRAAIPYRVLGGTKFYERAEIKDAMAYLITVANPADPMALRRVLNVPKRGIGSVTETTLQRYADEHETTMRDALRHAGELGFGPKVRNAITEFAALLDSVSEKAPTQPVVDTLTQLLDGSHLLENLRKSPDAQDAARADNIDELVAVTREFQKNNPEGTLTDFLTEVSLVAAADELDDSSGTVSLMTLHTAKGLEYEAVFLTGVEEDLLPHRMSANEPGGPSEERRLFYVGITRAKKVLFLSLAMTRAQFGDVNVAMPSRFLQEIPEGLIEWKQSPGMANSRGGTQPRALNAKREGGIGGGGGGGYRGGGGWGGGSYDRAAAASKTRPKTEWANRVSGQVRDNGDMELVAGDRIKHVDFGEGTVSAVTGQGAKRIAEIAFDSAGRKKLLIKIAPIEKL